MSKRTITIIAVGYAIVFATAILTAIGSSMWTISKIKTDQAYAQATGTVGLWMKPTAAEKAREKNPLDVCNERGTAQPEFNYEHPVTFGGSVELVANGHLYKTRLGEKKGTVKLVGLMPCQGFTLLVRDRSGKAIAQFANNFEQFIGSITEMDFGIDWPGTPYLVTKGGELNQTLAALYHDSPIDPRTSNIVHFEVELEGKTTFEYGTGDRHAKANSDGKTTMLVSAEYEKPAPKMLSMTAGPYQFSVPSEKIYHWIEYHPESEGSGGVYWYSKVLIKDNIAYIRNREGRFGPYMGVRQ